MLLFIEKERKRARERKNEGKKTRKAFLHLAAENDSDIDRRLPQMTIEGRLEPLLLALLRPFLLILEKQCILG